MHYFATALCACIMATVVVGGTALTPTPAEAAKTPTAEAVALKEATAACKAEAKEKKINSWLAGRRLLAIASQRLSNSRRPNFRRLP